MATLEDGKLIGKEASDSEVDDVKEYGNMEILDSTQDSFVTGTQANLEVGTKTSNSTESIALLRPSPQSSSFAGPSVEKGETESHRRSRFKLERTTQPISAGDPDVPDRQTTPMSTTDRSSPKRPNSANVSVDPNYPPKSSFTRAPTVIAAPTAVSDLYRDGII